MVCIELPVAPLRPRAFTDGVLLDLDAADIEEGATAVPKNTFWELTGPALECSCSASEDGSEATTALRWDSDDETSDNGSYSTRSSSLSVHAPPGNFDSFAWTSTSSRDGLADPSAPGTAWLCYNASGVERCQVEALVDAKPSKSKLRRSRGRRSNAWINAERAKEASEEHTPPEVVEERTTLLLKNLPRAWTTKILAELLDAEGFAGRFDFAYVPIDFTRQSAFGYAFVNFCTPADARKALEHLNGNDSWAAPGQESLEVQWSDPHQGLSIQIARYQNSPVMHPSIPSDLKPMLFEDGVRKEFPKPTKPIKVPRSRRRGHGADE